MARRDVSVDPPRVIEQVAVEVFDRPVGIPLCTGAGEYVPGAGVRSLTDEDDVSQMFDEEGPSRPYQIAAAFVALAGGWLPELGKDFEGLTLSDVVTAESLANWDLDEVAERPKRLRNVHSNAVFESELGQDVADAGDGTCGH